MRVLVYLRAIYTDWKGLLAGVFSIILAFWVSYFPPGATEGRVLLWIAASICLLIASYRAWVKQHAAVVMAEVHANQLAQELAETKRTLTYEREQNTPKLQGSILAFVSGDSSDIGRAQIFIQLQVRNIGAPSIVEVGPLLVTIHNREMTVEPFFIPEGYRLLGPDGSIFANFTRKDVFEEKIIEPVERGGQVRGWLRYVFEPDVKAADIQKLGTEYSVPFCDVLGQQYLATYTMIAEESTELKYFPGGGMPFRSAGFPVPPSKK